MASIHRIRPIRLRAWLESRREIYHLGKLSGLVFCGLLCLVAISSAQTPHANTTQIPPVEAAKLPGYSSPASGRWLESTGTSGVPVGGLGTGFIELAPGGSIRDICLWNNWLKPAPPQTFKLATTIGAGKSSKTSVLLSKVGDGAKPVPCRYFGHYPVVDMDFGQVSSGSAACWVRAFSPLVPGDANLSNVPAVFLTVTMRNTGAESLPVRFELAFADFFSSDSQAPRASPFRISNGMGMHVPLDNKQGFAVTAAAPGWGMTTVPPVRSTSQPTPAIVSAETILKAGEEKQVTFTLAWYSPVWTSTDGKQVTNRYAGRFADARGVATFAAEQSKTVEQKIIAWQSEIYAKNLPPWIKDAAINSLYALTRNSIWLSDGRLLVNDSFTSKAVTEATATRFISSLPLLLLYPEQEKLAVRSIAKQQAPSGEIPFGLGAPIGVETPMFGAQRPILSSEFVLMCYRDYIFTEDMEFLVGLYPRMKRALQYALTLDTDNDGLINEAPGSETGFPSNQFYDSWPWFGTSAYTAGIGLAALRAGEESARKCGDSEFAQWCHSQFEKGQAAYDDLLWTGNYYRLYADPDGFKQSDTCLANQLCGQTMAWLCGLGDLLNFEHVLDAVQEIVKLNVGTTERGAISGVKPDRTHDSSGGEQSSEILPCEVFNFATAALMLAARRDNEGLRKAALSASERVWGTFVESGKVWDQPFIFASRDGKPLKGRHYTGNLNIWALMFAIDGKTLSRSRAVPANPEGSE